MTYNNRLPRITWSSVPRGTQHTGINNSRRKKYLIHEPPKRHLHRRILGGNYYNPRHILRQQQDIYLETWLRAMYLYCGDSFMEEIIVTKFAFMISSIFYRGRRNIWRHGLCFRGSVTGITLQNVQQHLRWTGWWEVRQGKRSMFTLLTGRRTQISLRFNMEALWKTNIKKSSLIY